MRYAVEMGPCAMIYVPNLIKIGLAIQRLMSECTYIQTAWRSLKLTVIFQNKESTLMKKQTTFILFYIPYFCVGIVY
jgi:hypothetical protein